MGAITKIEWCDRTFNPWIGCTKVSEGCLNCYAEDQMATRWKKCGWGPQSPRVRTSKANWLKPLLWERRADRFMECSVCGGREVRGWDGYAYKKCTNPDCLALAETDSNRARQRVFCASFADWLDDAVPIEWLADLLALIMATPHLDWLLLTKRPELWGKRIEGVLQWIEGHADWYTNEKHPLQALRDWLADWFVLRIPPPNVWIGTSVENQEQANRRIPHLFRIPTVVRFLSCEPLLGAVDLRNIPIKNAYATQQGWAEFSSAVARGEDVSFHSLLGWIEGIGQFKERIHWVIVGGESNRNARPMHPDWANFLLTQCLETGVPYFYKQTGAWLSVYDRDNEDPDWRRCPTAKSNRERYLNLAGHHGFHGERVIFMRHVGKKVAGRLLNGCEWNQFPEVRWHNAAC